MFASGFFSGDHWKAEYFDQNVGVDLEAGSDEGVDLVRDFHADFHSQKGGQVQ
jgi:hypothetical protein